MKTLTLGADRDQLYIALDADQQRFDVHHRAPVLERNDHLLAASFLQDQHCDWASVDRFVFLAVPQSKTTVRVNATLLGTTAWYNNRPLTVIPVDSLDQPPALEQRAEESTGFDPSVLGQLH